MSRVELRNSNYEIAYGLDHLVGIFVQVWDLSRNKNNEENDPIVDLDEWSDKTLTVEKIVNIADEYGFHIAHELSEKTINLD